MEDLLARFLPQFVTLARTRIETAISATTKRDAESVKMTVRELHTLVGEAGLLGLGQVVPLARACEQKAKHLQGPHSDADVSGLVDALHELERVIDGIGGPTAP
ncbi:MAG TPA: Hpt domain-containing protein [Kofleriaceae bacterium]|nr:Hpt domain-containing protein [Kofleriaceae bacterium]